MRSERQEKELSLAKRHVNLEEALGAMNLSLGSSAFVSVLNSFAEGDLKTAVGKGVVAVMLVAPTGVLFLREEKAKRNIK